MLSGCPIHGVINLPKKKNSKDRRTPTMINVNAIPASWQAGLLLLARPLQKIFLMDTSVEEVCRGLGISRSAAYEAAELIGKRLTTFTPTAVEASDAHVSCNKKFKERDFEIEVLRYQLDHPGSREAGVRMQFDTSYKTFVESRRAHYGVTIERASQILTIPIDTMKKFHRVVSEGVTAASVEEGQALPPLVIELVNAYLRHGRDTKSVKSFCQRHPEILEHLKMNYRQVLGWLKGLGFVSSRGIFLKNKGLDKILRFKPNQVWGSDGKNLAVIINGEIFNWVWQCLVDEKTTVIVGGLINRAENTENLLTAIKNSKAATGISPMAIVLDNRLSEDLPAIYAYLKEMNIEVIRIFPGNSKSNGITEGNFNIFDRWVGPIEINGATPEELSQSIAQVFVEVFTQMRNHSPRAALSYKSAQEVADTAAPDTPEEEAETRAKLKAMADRLKNDQATPVVSEQKKAAIQQVIAETSPPHPDVFTKALENPRFTPNLILGSLAILKNTQQQQPQKRLGHAYFGGILRNLADQESLECLNTHLESVYVQHWDTMRQFQKKDLAKSLQSHPAATCTRLACDFVNMPVPAYAVAILVDLKNSFFLASQGSTSIAARLRESIATAVLQCKRAKTEKRETLLRKVFEWENFVRMTDWNSGDWAASPAGNA
jgi:hypothetical protein